MDCHDAHNLIAARIDGEIAPADLAAVEAHLAACESCRRESHIMASQHEALVRAFAVRRRRASDIAAAAIVAMQRPASFQRLWGPMLASAAAGFLLALLIFRPWQLTRGSATVASGAPQAVVGRLSLATGVIEVRAAGAAGWESIPTGGAVSVGARVRTGTGIRCELAMTDGSEVRLDGGTELLLTAARQFELAAGRMWSTVKPAQAPFQVAVARATVTALGTQFDILKREQSATLTVVQGSTRVEGQRSATVVGAAQSVVITNGVASDVTPVTDLLVVTSWVNELVAMKGRDNAELERRINDLLASIGQTKTSQMYESEIRALGDHCVLPLTRYIQSDRSRAPAERGRRDMAARIIGDLSQPWSIADLIGLLDDDDPDVRYHASGALWRLTGLEQGRTADQWRDATGGADEAIGRWRQWWAANNERYPKRPVRTPGP